VSPGVCCVTDTNIWIDLQEGGLLDSVFELDAQWLIPDLVERELGARLSTRLVEWGLAIRSLDGDEIEAVMSLSASYVRPSRTDLSTLVVANSEHGILVTGDGALRAAAKEEGTEVHGTLWIVDALVAQEIVREQEAARALQLMMDGDRRLPRSEVQKRINRWKE
jgi:hypothetical protein